MHRVLAIMGSPRRGDTYHLTQRIEEEMARQDEVSFDYLWLREADLRPCTGCCACFWGGEERCPLKDDRAEIERRMLDADGVIFASPVYALSMTGLMKTLLDRLAYVLHRPRFFEQKALIVVSAGAAGVKQTQDAIANVRYMGFDVVGRVGLAMLPKPWTRAEQRQMASRTERAGRSLLSAMQRNRRSAPNLLETMYFRVQQAAFEANREEQPADYEYFAERGWFDRSRRWYVDAPVNPAYDLLARSAAAMVRRQVTARQRALQREGGR